MTPGWETKRVCDIAEHQLGKMLDKAKNRGEPRQYLRNLNVRWFDFDLSDLLKMRFEPSELERYSVRKGDLLICEGGYPGRAAIWNGDEPIFFQKALHRVRFHEPARAKWCLYYLHYRDLAGSLRRHFNGSGIQHFTGEALAQFALPLPPLPEQRRIIAILDDAFEGITAAKANTEKNLRSASDLFAQQRAALFSRDQQSWPHKLLSEVAEVQSGGTPTVSTKEFWGGSIAWYSSGELNDIETSEPERFISEAGLAGSNAKVFPKGSLLIGMYDTAALKMSILDRTAAFNQAIAGVKPNRVLETEFLFHAISLQRPALLNLRRGVRQKNLSLSKIKEIVIPVPNVQVQCSIVDRLREAQHLIGRLQGVYQRKLGALDELKRSLLHQAFTGQLTSAKPTRAAAPSALQTTTVEHVRRMQDAEGG